MGGMPATAQTLDAYKRAKSEVPKALEEAQALFSQLQTLSTSLAKHNITLTVPPAVLAAPTPISRGSRFAIREFAGRGSLARRSRVEGRTGGLADQPTGGKARGRRRYVRRPVLLLVCYWQVGETIFSDLTVKVFAALSCCLRSRPAWPASRFRSCRSLHWGSQRSPSGSRCARRACSGPPLCL